MTLEQENLAKEQIKKRERLAREIFVKSVEPYNRDEYKMVARDCFNAADAFLMVAEEERNK